ncbi:MAG: glycosyltransferase family 39 protein [Phycisphaerae bacterium]
MRRCLQQHIWLGVVLATAVALSAALVGVALSATKGTSLQAPDSSDYLQLARSLRDTGSLDPLGTSVFRTPGYPILLAGARWAGDALGRASGGVALLLLVQQSLLAWVTYRLGRQFFPRGTATAAAALLVVSPAVLASSVRVLSDTPFAILLTASLWLMVRHLHTGRWKHLLAAAALLAAGCYVRPVGLVMALLYVAVLVVRRGRLARTAAFVALLVTLLAPWVVRNGTRAGYWGFSSNFPTTLYVYSAPLTLEAAEGLPASQARHQVTRRALQRAGALAEDPTLGEWIAAQQATAAEVIAQYPGTYAAIHLRGALAFWLPGGTDVLEVAGATRGQRGTLAVLREGGLTAAVKHYFDGNAVAAVAAGGTALLHGLIVLGAVVAACAGLRHPGRIPAGVWLMAAMLLTAFLLGGPVTTPRFRVPLQPVLCLAAAAGWGHLWRYFRRRRLDAAARSR